jgi:ATP-dependent DNA helicase RecQ
LRQASTAPKRVRGGAGAGARTATGSSSRGGKPPPLPLDSEGLDRFAALKAWRAEVAREHNLPAYVVFHDAALAEMARSRPVSLDELSQIGGVGAKKLDAYGKEILRVLTSA